MVANRTVTGKTVVLSAGSTPLKKGDRYLLAVHDLKSKRPVSSLGTIS